MGADVVAIIGEFVRSRLLADGAQPLTPETRLLTEGLIDSLGVTVLTAFLEERFDVYLDGSEIRAGGTETIREIAALVERR